MSAPNPYFLKLTESETVRFLELYQREEILWNTHLELYRSRPARLAAAQRVAQGLNVRGFTTEYVFIKFKNLRSSYCQELKKIAESMSAGASEVYRPKVFWFHTMNSFLRPFVQSRAAQSNLYFDSSDIPTLTMHEEDYTTHFMEQSYDQSISQSTTTDEPQFMSTWVAGETTSPTNHEKHPHMSTTPVPITSPPTHSKRMKHSELVNSDSDNYVITDLSTSHKNSIAPAVNDKDDSFECFGKYVASLLRNMPRQKAYKLQLEIATKLLHEQIRESDDRSDDQDGYLDMEKERLMLNGSVKAEIANDEFVDLTTEINYENY